MNQTIKDSKERASFIINEANKQKLLILEKAKNIAKEESKKVFLKNKIEIDTQVMQERKKLYKEIADLSISIAEKIIKKIFKKIKTKI